jgi:hypothetical protein
MATSLEMPSASTEKVSRLPKWLTTSRHAIPGEHADPGTKTEGVAPAAGLVAVGVGVGVGESVGVWEGVEVAVGVEGTGVGWGVAGGYDGARQPRTSGTTIHDATQPATVATTPITAMTLEKVLCEFDLLILVLRAPSCVGPTATLDSGMRAGERAPLSRVGDRRNTIPATVGPFLVSIPRF